MNYELGEISPIDYVVFQSIRLHGRRACLNITGWCYLAICKTHYTRNGRIPDNSILLIRTGFGRFYPDRESYLGTVETGQDAVANLHFPGLQPEAADWLVRNRSIDSIGLDTASIDFGQSQLFESHQILFKANIPAFENVANLHLLPDKGFRIIALPMKIRGGSGSPLRIIAQIK